MIKRITIQSTLVLEGIKKLKNHPTADEVYEAVAIEHPSISKATVYRNLNQLSEMGMIYKVELPDGPNHYDHICTEHYHIKCVKCTRVFDVDMDLINPEKNIRNYHGFQFLGHHITFDGICPECNKASSHADAQE